MLFIGIWASLLDGVTIVVDNFVMSPLVGVEKCSCSLVKTCENSRRLFACMLCEWRDSTLAIGKERREEGGCGTFCHPTLSIHMVTVS